MGQAAAARGAAARRRVSRQPSHRRSGRVAGDGQRRRGAFYLQRAERAEAEQPCLPRPSESCAARPAGFRPAPVGPRPVVDGRRGDAGRRRGGDDADGPAARVRPGRPEGAGEAQDQPERGQGHPEVVRQRRLPGQPRVSGAAARPAVDVDAEPDAAGAGPRRRGKAARRAAARGPRARRRPGEKGQQDAHVFPRQSGRHTQEGEARCAHTGTGRPHQQEATATN